MYITSQNCTNTGNATGARNQSSTAVVQTHSLRVAAAAAGTGALLVALDLSCRGHDAARGCGGGTKCITVVSTLVAVISSSIIGGVIGGVAPAFATLFGSFLGSFAGGYINSALVGVTSSHVAGLGVHCPNACLTSTNSHTAIICSLCGFAGIGVGVAVGIGAFVGYLIMSAHNALQSDPSEEGNDCDYTNGTVFNDTYNNSTTYNDTDTNSTDL